MSCYWALLLHASHDAHDAQTDIDPAVFRTSYEFLESCMRHKSEMVIYEAAKAVCDLPDVTAK